jgi:hypothetical protein
MVTLTPFSKKEKEKEKEKERYGNPKPHGNQFCFASTPADAPPCHRQVHKPKNIQDNTQN